MGIGMDDFDDMKLKIELEGISRTIDDIVKKVKIFESENCPEPAEDDS